MSDQSHPLAEVWPLFGLRVDTPTLTLAYLSDELIGELIEAGNEGIHDPDVMPFTKDWAIQPHPIRGRLMAEFYWSKRIKAQPESWHISFAVIHEGKAIGLQDFWATDFLECRTAESGSWLAQPHQGKGHGVEMRAALLHLLFDGLGAQQAETAAVENNAASLGVTRRLGYSPNGHSIAKMGDGKAARSEHFVMTREAWMTQRRDDITISGLDACLPFLGLDSGGATN